MDLCGDFKDSDRHLIPDQIVINITPGILEKAIQSTKSKKSCGPDGVPMLVMKDAFPIYRGAYLVLFNKILTEGVIPKSWKTATVTPVHKKGDRS